MCRGSLLEFVVCGKGDLRTSVQAAERNAVTWGVFPGQEIVQSTIIEQESFLTWKVRIHPSHFAHLGGLISCCPAGGGVLYLDQLGVSVPPNITGATAAGGHQRYPLVGQRHTPRLQRPRCALEVFVRRHRPGRSEPNITVIRRNRKYLHVARTRLAYTGSYV